MIDIESNIEQTKELSQTIRTALSGLFGIYTNQLKPVLTLVECFLVEFPIPILNEIRAVNDHVSRVFILDKEESEIIIEINKAQGHLTRAILDCYKCLLIVYERKLKQFFTQYKDVRIAVVNDGKFLPKLISLHNKAQELAFKAKSVESNSFPEKEQAFLEYKKAVLAYNEVDAYIQENSEGIALAAQYAKDETKTNYKFAIISAVFGAALGAIITLAIEFVL